jgi:class 3 adenylate cyclase/tetratricopeptide (TPR) repeat protein
VDVAAWLRSLGMERYEDAFRDNAIDSEVLPSLTAEDLKELGVTSVGHRRRLLDALARLNASGSPEGETDRLSEAAGERRQVAVLFADLTGFTAMSRELDAEEVHAVLGRYFERVDGIVEQHGGHIDKHVGDCVMAVFGAPVAHGNDAERATRAALAIRDAMPDLCQLVGRPISVHIGIAGGQVVASGTGSATHREYTVTGETVNLASRLTDTAGPGEILISEAVRRSLGGRVDCAERSKLAVKAFSEPILTWCLLGVRETAARHPFVGRRNELRQFGALLASCRETGRGQAVYVRGEAGIGKTRLLEESQRLAREAGFACHGGLVLDFGARTARDAVRSLVRGMLGLDAATDQSSAGLAAARACADKLVEENDAPFLNDLIDAHQSLDQRAVYDAMDNTTRIRGRRQVLMRLVERSSRVQPRLLTIEDIHWSDRSTLEDLAGLCSVVAECPAILLMTSRIEGDPLDQAWRALAGGAPLSSIDLGPLNAGEARLLAEPFLDATGDFAERCIERAGGNPLFLEQLFLHAKQVAEGGVPGSVQSLVQARLDRLDPADKFALQAASVLGQVVETEALDHLLGTRHADPGRLVSQLLLRPRREGFIFHHALIRDAVYDGLLKRRRRELHQRAAEWYAGRDAALHAEHLDRAADSGAARAYCDAARSQAAGYRYESALRLVERGIELADEPADGFALRCLRGDILNDLGMMPLALSAFEDALKAASNEEERCRAWIGLATVKRVTDDLGGAWSDLDRAAVAATTRGLVLEQARVHFLRGNLCFPRGDTEGCVREHGKSLALAREAGAAEQEAEALGGLGDAEYMRGRMMSAHDAFDRCVELCQTHGFGRIEVANRPMRGITACFAGDTRAGLDDALVSIAAAQKVGHRRAQMIAHLGAYLCLHDLVERDRAWEHVDAALVIARELRASRFEAEALAYRAELHRLAGRRAEALRDIGDALAIGRDTGMAYLGPFFLGVLAHATDDPAIFEQSLAEAETLLAGAVSHNHFLFRRDAIEACIERGAWGLAEAHAAALESYAAREPSRYSAFVVARARALLTHATGNRDEACVGELQGLKEQAQRCGYLLAIPAIDAAIGSGANGH